MSACDEVPAGKVGRAFSQFLAYMVSAVATSRNFPLLEGGAWSHATAPDVATSFLADNGIQRRLDWLALPRADANELVRALPGVVRNYLRDLGREAEVGHLVVEIKRVHKECDDFIKVEVGRWVIRDRPLEASGAGPGALVAAVAALPATFESYDKAVDRRAPIADNASPLALATPVREAAEGTLPARGIAQAMAPSLHVVTGDPLREFNVGDYPDQVGDVASGGVSGGSGDARKNCRGLWTSFGQRTDLVGTCGGSSANWVACSGGDIPSRSRTNSCDGAIEGGW